MKFLGLIYILLVVFIFAACDDSTDPITPESVENTKDAMAEIDLMMVEMMTGPTLFALESMPDLTLMVDSGRLQK